MTTPTLDARSTTDRTIPPAFELATLDEARARIAELRQQRCHLTAGIMRDEMLSQIEAWLDPDGAAHTASLQAEQGRQARRLGLQVDDFCGF